MNIRNNKWYIYQKERFPLGFYIPAVLIICFGAVKYACFCMRREGIQNIPHLKFTYLFVCLEFFLFYMLFRIVDERKDYQKDKLIHPERPVSRGLITLQELRQLEIVLGVLQTAVVIAFNRSLLLFHIINWGYFALMTKEYFHPEFMEKHEYLDGIFHQFILLLLDVSAIESIGINYQTVWAIPKYFIFLFGRYAGFLALFSAIYAAKQKKPQKADKMVFLWFVFSVFVGQYIVWEAYKGIAIGEIGSTFAGLAFLVVWIISRKAGKEKSRKAVIGICCLWIAFFSVEMGLLP